MTAAQGRRVKTLVPALARRRAHFRGGLALCLAMTALGAIAQPGRDYVVVISSMSYGRIPSGLGVGDTITWTNHDSVPHTVTARDRSFDLHVNPGQSVRMSLKTPGSFPFYCIYHSTMRGTLTVAAK